ncbi:MAG: glycoside hydrolase family 75 protein [Roseimicrobium sp.]
MSKNLLKDSAKSRETNHADLPPPEDDSLLPERWHPSRRIGFYSAVSRLLLLGIVLTALVLPFTPYAGRVKRAIATLVEKARETKVVFREVPKPVIQERIVEIPAPPPALPTKFVPRKEVDIATLHNGISIQTKLDAQQGTYASIERKDPNAYTVEFQLKLRIPKANDTLSELARVNPELPKMLPGLDSMLKTGRVSGFYHKLYDKKTALVQQNLTRLTKLLDRHNFFDCETILELTHPTTQRRALLIQSEMDVVSDGSDGDRMPWMSPEIYNSDYYQPFTSYEWAKRTSTPNPLATRYFNRYDVLAKAYKEKGLSKDRNAELKAEMQELDARLAAFKSRSSLIAEKDPFIVLSLLFKDYPRVLPHAPAMGDYAAVIHGKQILPAICGDYGPSMKMGEASLMIAKKINEKATPNIRPESDLKVTYLIFPGTAEKPFGPPNLERWYEKVTAYLKDCGGIGEGYALHKWENPFPPPPPVAPTPPVLAVTQEAANGATTTTTPETAPKQAALNSDSKAPASPPTATSTAPVVGTSTPINTAAPSPNSSAQSNTKK